MRQRRCDCCSNPATKLLSADTSIWCADWFIGYHCEECHTLVEDAMIETVLGLNTRLPHPMVESGTLELRQSSNEELGNGRREGDVNDVAHMLYRSEF